MSAEDRRAQLVGIGLQLLETRPIHELALDEVAAAAGVSRTLVFHYFPSKGDFYAAVVATLGERLLLDAPGDPDADVPTRLRAMVAGFLKFVRLHRGAYVTLVRGASGGEPQVLEILDTVRASLVELWLDAAEWPERDDLTRLVVRGWLGSLEEIALVVARSGVPRAAAVELLVGGLLDDLRRASALQAAGTVMPGGHPGPAGGQALGRDPGLAGIVAAPTGESSAAASAAALESPAAASATALESPAAVLGG